MTLRSFILRSPQQEEALHCIWYALRRWRLISWQIVFFLTTAFSKSFSRACMTTPCPTTGWPPVTWKGSGAHVPLSVQAARAPTRC
ncbi:unnamed protein product [Spirodela intermedia]|uniref:Uncharacterized protein n=1 Tax=Spirodela intermedia TaxID=51605 RepID=A0A7I8K7G5_SPIIN|nr:unnamed protein product [Spirodela intermedia]